MIVKRVRYYLRRINKIGDVSFGQQQVRVISFWLLGIIPLYINSEVVKGDCEK